MMWFQHLSDTEIIFALFAAIYLSECVYWISHQAVCFSALGHRFRPLRRVGFLSNEDGGLVLPVPAPFRISFVCEPWPVCVSPEGIYPYAGHTVSVETVVYRDSGCVPFQEDWSIELSGREVRVNRKPLASFTSASHAQFFKECLQGFSASCQLSRPEAIDKKLKAMTDIDEIRKRLSTLRHETANLKVASTILFLYTFGLGPALYYLAKIGTGYGLWVYLGGFVTCWLLAVLSFYSAHSVLYPSCVKERRKRCAMMVLSPATAMRAPSTLSRNMFASFHPVAVAAVLCARQTFLEFARPFFLDLHSAPTESCAADSASFRTEQWFRDHLGSQLLGVLHNVGVEVAELVKAPLPDSDARSYCPRCHSQFVLENGTCKDCGGLQLKPFGKHLNELPPASNVSEGPRMPT